MMTVDSIYIEQRFDILRNIIAMYQARLKYMEQEVVELFSTSQLHAIEECMQEKQRLEAMVKRLEQFVSYWEANASLSIDH